MINVSIMLNDFKIDKAGKDSLVILPSCEDSQILTYSSASAEEYLLNLSEHPVGKDELAAKEIIESMKSSVVLSNGKIARLTMKSSYYHFKKYGHGFFFLFLAKVFLQVAFLVLALTSIPALYYNFQGAGLRSLPGATGWVETTLANQPNWRLDSAEMAMITGSDLNQIRNFVGLRNYRISEGFQRHLIWDCSFIVLAIIAIFLLRLIAYKQEVYVDKHALSVAKFCLRLGNLPNESFSKADLIEYISAIIQEPIIELSFSYKMDGCLAQYLHIESLNRQLQKLKARAERKEKTDISISRKESEIKLEQEKLKTQFSHASINLTTIESHFERHEAFVMFENSVVPRLICSIFKTKRTRKLIDEIISQNPKFAKFRQITAGLSDDIANVNFEKSKVTTKLKAYQIFRACLLAFSVCALAVLGSVVIDFGFKQFRPNYACNRPILWPSMQQVPISSSLFGESYHCFCETNYWTADPSSTFRIQSFCGEYISSSHKYFY